MDNSGLRLPDVDTDGDLPNADQRGVAKAPSRERAGKKMMEAVGVSWVRIYNIESSRMYNSLDPRRTFYVVEIPAHAQTPAPLERTMNLNMSTLQFGTADIPSWLDTHSEADGGIQK